ncbi:MAG TPA: serine/threonine-protein kinase [Pyrinomonadaceae bacterium]|nr:serine/threonine-protein kinase [Pyrinomonadaceae bacterium]
MRCQSCQSLLVEDAEFCGTCGLPTSRHPSDAATQIDVQQQTNADEPRPTDDRGASQQDPRTGLILDSKYKLIESLGQGGMGSVFRAERLHIGDEVAVKLLHQDLVREKHALERFRREARTAAMIRHPNVVSIHDFNDGTGLTSEAYIVMELVQGVSLGTLLRRHGRMSSERAVRLMQDICAGVGVAHRQGLLHRDLKPDNVIVVPPSHEGDEETAKVVDFGLAKVRDVAAQSALTQTGAVLGTLYYMSPEQCSGEELDARADVYSLGAMLYEMLTGGPPFRSNNFTGLISKHLHEPPPHFPPSLGVPPAIESVCLRALAKNRNQRQPDAIAFGRELQRALDAPVGFQSPVSVSTRRSPLRWIVAAVGVFVALIAIIGVGIAIQFGVNRMQASRDVAENVNQAVNQNSIPVDSPPVVSASSEDLRGVWAGTYGPFATATKLTVKNHNGNSLDGVLEQGTLRVAFKGTYDSRSRTLTMKQTEVLSGEGWNLGEDVGKLSADGKKISGTGTDPLGESLGISYQWTFTRK